MGDMTTGRQSKALGWASSQLCLGALVLTPVLGKPPWVEEAGWGGM